jgi:hypothetical protein
MTHQFCSYTASRDLRDTLEASHPPYPPIKNFKPASDPMNSKNGVVDKHKRPCLATEVAHGPGVSPATEKETASHQDGFQDTILNHAGGDDPIDIVEDDEPVPVEGMYHIVYSSVCPLLRQLSRQPRRTIFRAIRFLSPWRIAISRNFTVTSIPRNNIQFHQMLSIAVIHFSSCLTFETCRIKT